MSDDLRAEVANARAGDARALDSLIVRHLPSLMAFVRLQAGALVRSKESLRDVVQSACVEALRDAASFEYRGDAQFRRWLFTQALNKIRNKNRHYRAGRRAAGKEVADDDGALAEGYATLTPSRVAVAREDVGNLEAAFAMLPEDQREAVLLRRIVGMDYGAIASAMAKSEGAVRNLVYRGVARLAMLLRREPPPAG